jgi:hypothetical protein
MFFELLLLDLELSLLIVRPFQLIEQLQLLQLKQHHQLTKGIQVLLVL